VGPAGRLAIEIDHRQVIQGLLLRRFGDVRGAEGAPVPADRARDVPTHADSILVAVPDVDGLVETAGGDRPLPPRHRRLQLAAIAVHRRDVRRRAGVPDAPGAPIPFHRETPVARDAAANVEAVPDVEGRRDVTRGGSARERASRRLRVGANQHASLTVAITVEAHRGEGLFGFRAPRARRPRHQRGVAAPRPTGPPNLARRERPQFGPGHIAFMPGCVR